MDQTYIPNEEQKPSKKKDGWEDLPKEYEPDFNEQIFFKSQWIMN